MVQSGIVAVIGATGQQGGATARRLLAAGVATRAMVRDPHKISRPAEYATLSREDEDYLRAQVAHR